MLDARNDKNAYIFLYNDVPTNVTHTQPHTLALSPLCHVITCITKHHRTGLTGRRSINTSTATAIWNLSLDASVHQHPPAPMSTIITLDNVHKCSLFELRQELTRRAQWQGDVEAITYSALLSKMVAILVKDKEDYEAQARQETNRHSGGDNVAAESLKER